MKVDRLGLAIFVFLALFMAAVAGLEFFEVHESPRKIYVIPPDVETKDPF